MHMRNNCYLPVLAFYSHLLLIFFCLIFVFALDACVTDTQIRVLWMGFVHVLTTPWKIAQVHRTATKIRCN